MSTNPLPQPQNPSLESEQRAHEPSMEEILASIRRIIADDDALPLVRRPSLVTSEPAPPAAERSADFARHPVVQSLSAAPVHLVAVPAVEPPEPRDSWPATGAPRESTAASGNEDVFHDDTERAPPPFIRGDMPEGAHSSSVRTSEPENHALLSSAFAGNRGERKSESTPLISASTDASVASSFQSLATSMFLRDSDLIARTVREMLRPMLKQWLDDNLPVMVERLVRAEIERVARGGR
ncbi:MAG: DUF2497 domain-containing protein [Methylobacteriaceae bacterium]|nr:DUF2497 domain-containing protein [Methylobacteriaceae bacterium]